MAAGPFIIPDKALLNIGGPVNLLNTAKTFALSYHTSAWVPNQATVEVFADVTNEIAAAGGYTAGGITLANDALSIAGGAVKFTCDPAEIIAAGGSIPAWRTAVIRAVGNFGGKVDPIVAYCSGSLDDQGNPQDMPATTTGNKLSFTPNVAGILAITRA